MLIINPDVGIIMDLILIPNVKDADAQARRRGMLKNESNPALTCRWCSIHATLP
jgi:hypothetical protein